MKAALMAPAEVPEITGKGFGASGGQQFRDGFEHTGLISGACAAARQHQSHFRARGGGYSHAGFESRMDRGGQRLGCFANV